MTAIIPALFLHRIEHDHTPRSKPKTPSQEFKPTKVKGSELEFFGEHSSEAKLQQQEREAEEIRQKALKKFFSDRNL